MAENQNHNNPDQEVAPMEEESQANGNSFINTNTQSMDENSESVQSEENAAPQEPQKFTISQVGHLVRLSWLLQHGYIIAKLKANRTIKDKSVRAKMKSLKKYGQLIPATYVTGAEATEQGLELINFFTEKELESEEYEKAIVIIDGQHRLKAHINLLKEKPAEGEEKYNKDYVLMPTLNPEAAISNQLCEINSITTPWDGSDFGHAAITMIDSEELLPALEYVAELTGKGCSLPAASVYATFTDKINKSVLIRAIDGSINDILKEQTNLEYGKKIRTAVEKVFDESFVNGRLLPNWIQSKFNDRPNSKEEFVNSIVAFFATIDRQGAKQIEKLKGSRGGETKETLVNRKLSAMYAEFLNKNAQ